MAPPITMRQAFAASSAHYDFYPTVVAIFGAIAPVLTASGLYGLMTARDGGQASVAVDRLRGPGRRGADSR